MIRAYLFALDPTPKQAEAMRSHCGAARYAFNWCLALVKAFTADFPEGTRLVVTARIEPPVDTQ